MAARWLLSPEKQLDLLPTVDEQLLFSLERRYLDVVDFEKLELAPVPVSQFDPRAHLRFIRTKKVIHDDAPESGLHLANMQNVLASLREDDTSVIFLLLNDSCNTRFYHGLVQHPFSSPKVSIDRHCGILQNALIGNYLHVDSQQLTYQAIQDEILKPLRNLRGPVQAISGIPSLRERDSKNFFFQGLDRFIDGMRGFSYGLMILAEPISLAHIDRSTDDLFTLGTSIHSYVKSTIQQTRGLTQTLTSNLFGMFGMTEGVTRSFSDSQTTGSSASYHGEGQVMVGLAGMVGTVLGTLVFPGVGTMIGGAIGTGLGTLGAYQAHAPINSVMSSSHSFVRSIANTSARQWGTGGSLGYSMGWNRSISVTTETLNKKAEHCEQLCDQYIKRLQDGKNTGFWNVGVYLLGDELAQNHGRGLLRSVLSGDETHWESMRALRLPYRVTQQYLLDFLNPKYNLFVYGQELQDLKQTYDFGAKIKQHCKNMGKQLKDFVKQFFLKSKEERVRILEHIRRLSVDLDEKAHDKIWQDVRELHLGHPMGKMMGGVSTPMNTRELSLVMNFPRREVPGLSLRQGAGFGVNYEPNQKSAQVHLGTLLHKGMPVRQPAHPGFSIDRNSLCQHAFMCGLTGSGKTNTCIQLLKQLNAPFLVIEPAKSEYRQLIRDPELEIVVYTIGNENLSPFRLNPFEFVRGIELLTHIDHLKTVFNASFPMYASMPYLLEEAIIAVYLDKGWELGTSTNRYIDVLTADDVSDYYPTLEDLIEKVDEVVDSKNYGPQLRMDLSAALRARLSSLICGGKGLTLNTKRSTPMSWLLKRNVILELRYLGDDDEKAFLIGMLLTRLYEYREAESATTDLTGTPQLRHLTVIEEAHRLLKNVPIESNQETSNVRGKAVETFSNIISEVRAYGEGFLVIDQIPSKLTPDVIKNTNLKLVHRTLATDDRIAVGATMNLSPEQSQELALLKCGEVIVHTGLYDKAFRLQVPYITGGLKPRVKDAELKQKMNPLRGVHREVFHRFPGFDQLDGVGEMFRKMDFREFDAEAYEIIIGLAVLFIQCRGIELQQAVAASLNLLGRCCGNDSLTACGAYLIWYCNWFFQKVNKAYRGQYDHLLAAHQFFVIAWFSHATGRDNLRAVEAFANAMRALPDPYGPMLKWYAARVGKKVLPEKKTAFTTDHCNRMDDKLEELIKRLTLNVSVPVAIKNILKYRLLDTLSRSHEKREEIVQVMRARWFRNGH